MYSKILVAMDGSDTSEHALQQAVELARKLSAQLRIIHVVDMGWLTIGSELAINTDATASAMRSAGERIAAEARATVQEAGFETETVLIETETPSQHVAEAIAREASRWSADLVVLGTHGHRGFRHLMLGSVAEQMARQSSMSTLLIPPPKNSTSVG